MSNAAEGAVGTAIAARVTAYLHRHLAFYESSLAAVARLDPGDADALEAYLEGLWRNEAAAAQLNTEQEALLKEWRGGAGVDAAVQRQVRELAARAEALAVQLAQAYEVAEMRAEAASAVLSARMQSARKGAGFSRKFQGGTPENLGGLVDRQI